MLPSQLETASSQLVYSFYFSIRFPVSTSAFIEQYFHKELSAGIEIFCISVAQYGSHQPHLAPEHLNYG